ncbi:zinc C2H2 type [Schistosoma japonicum]|uniref:Zinc C2H2 type n=1 Tax=Schistosoma japonicum TaxID=6182 RepID=A0A4Z2DFM8_SCHJA|nr:zinc C2H2 type [Schistosoma japonicum]
MSVASQHDVMIAKVALPEQRGNFLLSSIKQESCDTVSVTPASTDNLPITTTTTISELVRSTNQVQSESTFYITPPPYFPTAEHLTIPGPHPPTWSTLNQKQVSEACSRPLRLHSVPTLLNPSPIINNVTTITPVLVSGVIPSCLPQQNQSLSNPIRLRNPPINAFVNNHLRLPSSENTTALYPGVFLGGSITPPIIQSFGSNIPNVLNGTPAYHPLLHNNHSSAQRALSASSTRAVQSSTYLPLNVPIQPQQLMNNTRYCSTVSSTNDLNRVISNSFNVNDSINRSNNNDNDINSLTIVHCHLGNSCINHPSLNKDCNPVEQVCSSFEPHQKSLNQSIRRSNSLEPVNINQIIATKTVALPTHSSEISVSAIDKQTFTTAVSFHSSATIATTIAPDIVTATSNYDSSMENSTFDGVLWGRLCRRADGDLMFPGLSQTCTFRGANSMLKQIFQMIRTTEDSLSLQLPASALRNEIDSDLRLENHPSASLLNPVSKKGFHICLCCRLTFTSSNLYECHLNRSIAHIHYRCHLCLESNVIPQATTNQSDMNLVPSTTNSVGTIRRNPIDKRNISITNNSNGDVIHFQFYSVLPGGIIKATNHCAIFNHFTSTHPNQMNLWTLKPSLLTIYPLTKSLTCSDSTKSSLSDLLSNTPSGKSFTSLVPNRSDEFESDSEFFNDLCSSAVFSDLRQSLNNISAFDNFDLLHSSSSSFKSVDNVVDDNALSNSSINLDDYHNNVIIEEFSSLQRIFTPSPNSSHRQQIISNDKGATDHHRQHHHQLYPHLPRLPSPDSLLFRVILNLANSEIWHSHLFLSNWCDNNSSNTTSFRANVNKPKNVGKNNSTNIVINIDDDEDDVNKNGLVKLDGVNRNDDNFYNATSATTITTTTTNANNNNSGTNDNSGKNVGDSSISKNKSPAKQSLRKRLCDICLPPSAPSNTYLNQALGYLQISSNHNNHDHHNLTSVSYTTKTNPTSDALSIDNGKRKSKNLNENRQSGVLCCLICKYRTNDPKLLVDHLIGDPPLIQTKCGLCGQVLYINEPLLCSVKAHLLLHLGCFLMCPRCGFTPPLYLAPDCAQLCLRVHLRFVCYHFNLKEVYQCKYCEGHGKGFLTYENLCQHHLEHHVKRIYSCLWCVRLQVNTTTTTTTTTNNNNYSNDNTNCASHQLNDHSNNNTVVSINNFVAPVDQIPKKHSSYTVQHHMNEENIKLLFSTVSSQTQSHLNSNKSNSSNDSGDSSLHNKNQSIFRSTSIQEISHHLKSFHWPFVSSPSPVIEQVNNNEITEQQPMCSMTETVMTVNAPMSTISDGRDDSTALSKLNSNFNNLCTNSDVSQTTKSQNNPLPPHHPHNRKRNMKSILSFNLVPHVDYSIAFQCIECLKEINTKENYADHFQAEHGSKYIRECFYRCFGACKRLLPNIDVFREHLTNCLHAQSIYYATFGHLYNKDKTFDLFSINSSLNVTSMQDKQLTITSEQQSTLDDHLMYSKDLQNIDKHNTSSSPGCRLCFCAYCGIGSQRKSTWNYSSFSVLSSLSPKSDLVLVESCASDDGNSLPDVNNNLVSQNSINNPPNNSVNCSLQSQNWIRSNSVPCPLSEGIRSEKTTHVTASRGNTFNKRTTTMTTMATTTTTTTTTNRDNFYTPQYFTNLITLQNHEKSCHYSKSTNLIACPWCRKYISFSKKDKVNITYLHLFSHLREHCMASWYFDRMRQWNKNAKGLPHCVCGSALLDSPLAIFSHAAAHLLYTNKSLIFLDSSPHYRPHQQHSSSSVKSQSNSSKELLFPKYSDHIPCSVEIYRHSISFDAKYTNPRD